MSAREALARGLAAKRNVTIWEELRPWTRACYRTLALTVERILDAAGYTIIRDDENHKATVERCAQIADEIEQPGIPGTSQWLALGNFAGQIRDEIRSLIKEDGEC